MTSKTVLYVLVPELVTSVNPDIITLLIITKKKNNASKEKLAKLLKNPFLCEECS